MNLVLFFRLIQMSIFQKRLTATVGTDYDSTLFFCPVVVAKDGFSVSLQCHNSNYCASNEGYRRFGHTMVSVEFGFTSIHEELMDKYAESEGDTTGTVGKIPLDVMENVFQKHGGIDWEATLSVQAFERLVNGKNF